MVGKPKEQHVFQGLRLVGELAVELGIMPIVLLTPTPGVQNRNRHGLAWVMRRKMGMPLKTVAHILGAQDHTSIMHSERLADRLRLTDRGFRDFTDRLGSNEQAQAA